MAFLGYYGAKSDTYIVTFYKKCNGADFETLFATHNEEFTKNEKPLPILKTLVRGQPVTNQFGKDSENVCQS